MTIRFLLVLLILALAGPAYAGRCALIDNGSISEFRKFVGDCPPDPKGKTHLKWLPAPEVAPPAFDSATQVRTGPNHTVGQNSVTQSYTVRDKTAQELGDDKTRTMSRMNRGVIKVLCRLENHDRVSDGKAALTPAQCRAAFKSLL